MSLGYRVTTYIIWYSLWVTRTNDSNSNVHSWPLHFIDTNYKKASKRVRVTYPAYHSSITISIAFPILVIHRNRLETKIYDIHFVRETIDNNAKYAACRRPLCLHKCKRIYTIHKPIIVKLIPYSSITYGIGVTSCEWIALPSSS